MDQRSDAPVPLLRAGPLETGFLFGFGFFLAGAIISAFVVFLLTFVHSGIQVP
jgi:hypothetical protein